MIGTLKDAWEDRIFTRFSIASANSGRYIITHAFLHGNTNFMGMVFPLHLFGNLLALFAIGMSLEDLWGRGPFLLFYLAGAVAGGIPTALSAPTVPLIGASGAILATMGAFLIRLPHEKLRIAWALNPLALITIPVIALVAMFGRKPWGIVR
jgi:membrane associated rhomboid family serine protease